MLRGSCPDLDPKMCCLFFLARLRPQSKLEMRGRSTLSAFRCQHSAKTASRNAKKSRTRIYPSDGPDWSGDAAHRTLARIDDKSRPGETYSDQRGCDGRLKLLWIVVVMWSSGRGCS